MFIDSNTSINCITMSHFIMPTSPFILEKVSGKLVFTPVNTRAVSTKEGQRQHTLTLPPTASALSWGYNRKETIW